MRTLDWIIVALYLVLLLVSGWWLARREPSGAREYFIAGRRMPTWAVVFSIIASSLSVATFIGVPEQSYGGNLTYLSTNLGGILAIFVVAWVFIPAFYKADCVSIYELLERRMGHGARQAASAAFMIGRTFASGTRVYIAAIPIAAVLFGLDRQNEPGVLIGAIALLSVAAILYTLVGGIASVIWTDVIQTIVMLGAIIAAVIILASRIHAPIGKVVAALQDTGPSHANKLLLLDPGIPINPGSEFTLLTAIFGFTLLGIASYGTDHDMVQRMLTCRSAVKGGRSAIAAVFTGIPIVALFLVLGLLLFVYYQLPALTGHTPARVPGKGEPALIMFIVNELPIGLAGVMVAGLFAVGLGSLNSAINAMAATFVRDFYTQWRPGQSDKHYLMVGRWAVVGWGIVLAAFAVFCIFWKRANPDTSLISFALGVMNFAFAGLLAVFLTALCTRRGNSASAIAAIIVGFVITVFFQKPLWQMITGEDAVTLAASYPWLRLAFPWQLPIATAVALFVCCLGRPRAGDIRSAPVHSDPL